MDTFATTCCIDVAIFGHYEIKSGDKDFKKFIYELIENVVKPVVEENENILKLNSVGLPEQSKMNKTE